MTPYRFALFLAAVAISTSGIHAQDSDKPTAPASESNPAVPAAGHSLHGESYNEGPRQAAILLPGQGEVNFPVTTTSPEAQKFINQGVAQLHTFYYLEAERSFRQAAKLDPNCVMAYWGMAMANTNNAKRAKGFLKDAFAKAALNKITPREQLYLDALNHKYKEGGDAKGKRQSMLQTLEKLVQDYPDDLDARAWLAMTTWDNANSGDGIGSRQAVEELLRSVERVAPMHPGMHHYRIHLWDGVKQEMAVKSAELYAAAVPNIAHAWHMPGHTFTGLKRYDDAAYQQEGSARVDHAAMSRDRIMPFEIHNYAHNNQWLATSLSHAGRPHLAIQVARNLVVQPRDPAKNNKTDGGSAQRSGRSRWSEVLVRYELWDDLIDATNSGDLDWSDLPAEQRDKHYNLGIAYAWKGDNSNARAQVDALKAMAPREEKAEEKKDEQKDGKRERTIDTKSQVAEIEAIVLLNEGKTDEALKRLDDANSMRPEAKARFQLRAGKSELALSNINKTVSSHTNEVPPLACQVELLHAAGKDAEAKDAYARLLALNDLSEAGVPVYDRLRAIASAWSAAGWQAHAAEKPATTGPNRIDLTMLGPLCWAPVQAEPIVLNDSDGKPWNLSEHHGRTVVALFYLGGKCAHCVQQLEAFGKDYEAFKAMGVDIVAIGTDDQATAQGLKSNTDGIKFPMPLLIDSGLRTFKAYRAYDDFEDQPLHGTFLIDSQGGVRFQNISYTPFMDVAFVKQEAERVTQLLRNNQRPGAVARQGCQP